VSFRIILLLLLFSSISVAQTQITKSYFLTCNFNHDADHVGKYLHYSHTFADSSQAYIQIQSILNALNTQSYFLATLDDVYWRNDSCMATISIGNKLIINKLNKGNLPEWLLKKIDFKETYFENKVFKPETIASLCSRTLSFSQDHGYPFASIKLDSIAIENQQLNASVNFKFGPFFKFDTLLIAGKTNIKRQFLENYLRIESGEVYSQEKVDNIARAIQQLPYLKLTGPINVFFNSGTVRVELILEDVKSNQVDGIVGLLPNAQKDGGVMLTGEFNLVLRNLFQTGKMIKGEWRRFQEASQLLNLEYLHPNVLHSDFDVSGAFNFLKQDSTFLNINRKFSLFYRLNSTGKLSLNIGYLSARIGSNRTLKSATVLPSFADFDYVSYGLGYDFNSVDNLFYPRKGLLLHVDIAIGNKVISKNAIFDSKLYDPIALKSVMMVGNVSIEKFIRVAGNSVFLLKTVGGKIVNKTIFFNDLYRLGGLKSLRGFNDNYFYASDFNINTVEFRQYIDETSYLLLFAEQSYLYYNLAAGKLLDYPTGLGAGVSFTSGPGIFSFVYSVGKSKQQQMSLNQSKIHFGFISRF
jgi:translocation and assembly module TamA